MVSNRSFALVIVLALTAAPLATAVRLYAEREDGGGEVGFQALESQPASADSLVDPSTATGESVLADELGIPSPPPQDLPFDSSSDPWYEPVIPEHALGKASNTSFRRALTWRKLRHDPEFGIDLVGCKGGDPYVGDTEVEATLPILAIRVKDYPRPNYAVDGHAHAMEKQYYRGWSGGEIALTPAIRGSLLTSREVADDYCRLHCGEGFRMADFHDGKYVAGMDLNKFHNKSWPGRDRLETGGWYFWAYGDIPADSRFWVAIGDQSSNCWDR